MAKEKTKRELADEQARSERDGAVRRINTAFTRQIPPAAASSGVHEVPSDEMKAAPKLPVPDGRYRVLGLDWVHEFKGGKWIASAKARPDMDPSGIVEVP